MITIDLIDERINNTEKSNIQGNRPSAGILGLGWIANALKFALGKHEELAETYQDERLHRNGRSEHQKSESHRWMEKQRSR
jgi:hypothetical protein